MEKFCKKCGSRLNETTCKCQNCDEVMEAVNRQCTKSNKKTKRVLILLITVIIFVSISIIFILEPIKYSITLYMLEKGDYEKTSEMISKLKYKREDFVFCVGKMSSESLEGDDVSNQDYEYIYSYDSFGNCIERRYIPENVDLESDEIFIIKYEFDDNGNCTKLAEYDFNNNLILSEDVFYDKNNNVVKSEVKNENGSVTESFVTEYDSENKITVRKAINSLGEVTAIYNYFYNSNGDYEKIEYVDSDDGELYKVLTYNYDSDGNCVKIISDFCKEGWIMNCEYKFDVDGHCISEKNYSSLYSSGIQLIEYVYDENDNLVKEISKQTGEVKENYTATTNYTYDINNNLIEEKTEKNSSIYGNQSWVKQYSDYKIFYKPKS